MRGQPCPGNPGSIRPQPAGDWVPLYRGAMYEFLDNMPPRVLRTAFLVWTMLLARARQKPGNVRGTRLERGQALGGGRSLAEFCRLTHREVRTALSLLKKRGYLTQHGCVITIVDFDRYVPSFNTSDAPTDTDQDTGDGTHRDPLPGTPSDTPTATKQEPEQEGEAKIIRIQPNLPIHPQVADSSARRRRAKAAWRWAFKLLGPNVSLEAVDSEERDLWDQAFSMGFSDTPTNRKRLRWALCYVCGSYWIGQVLKSAADAETPGAWIQSSLETACIQMFEDPDQRKHVYPVDDPRCGAQ